jgi:hypothetical protein
MVMPRSGCFAHRAVLRRQDGRWRGRAQSNQEHDGLIGDAPEVELAAGVVTLRRTSGAARRSVSRAPAVVGVRAGAAMEAVLRDGDELAVHRAGTGDLGAALFRNGELILAVGAVEALVVAAGFRIEIDPRMEETEFPYLAWCATRRDASLIWIDPQSPDLEATLAELDRLPSSIQMINIVVRGDDWAATRSLNQRTMEWRGSAASRSFTRVPLRFRSRDEFLAYIKDLPRGWPLDPSLTIEVDGVRHELREGEYRWAAPWHLYVNLVSRPGIPGDCSQLGFARADPALTAECLIASAKSMAAEREQFSPFGPPGTSAD